MGRGPDLWQLCRLAMGEAGRDVLGLWRSFGHGWRPRAVAPTRLLFAPHDLRTSDPTIAQDVYSGYFVFAGRAIQVGGRSPFEIASPSRAWSEDLFGFGWLRHLRAADTALARDNARALVSEALGTRGRPRRPVGRNVRVAARRLISFLCQSPLLLAGADHVFYARFLRAIGIAVRDLEHGLLVAPQPLERLSAAVALCYAAVCCEGLEGRVRRATRALSAELEAQILPDGGHLSRNPEIIVELLLDFLPLKQVFASRGLEAPEALDRAIDRMLPMLRLFRHGDGALALFNGMGRTAFDHLATLVSYDPVQGEPAHHATYSGYERIEAGSAVLIADFGAAPPVTSSGQAHAGCLSFELSSGPDRIVVNCGAPAFAGPLREAARETAAHSTLVLDDTASCVFLSSHSGLLGRWLTPWLEGRLGRAVLSGPSSVADERHTEANRDVRLLGRHDGYLARYGFQHERRLTLAADGKRLAGQDALLAGEDSKSALAGAVIRFHLHPGVDARLEADWVEMRLPGGARWRFGLIGSDEPGAGPPVSQGRLALEESVFFADSEGRRARRQIVVVPGTDALGRPAVVKWFFAQF